MCDGYGHSADQSGSSTAVSEKRSIRATALLLTLATFNVLTITEKSGKRGNLAADCFNFKVDLMLMAVQETKCREFEDTMLYHTDNQGFDHKYLLSILNNSMTNGIQRLVLLSTLNTTITF